jgi:3-hydroxyisobutyrate dehydrogenase-like beta-hydroxyacid dehydrogenase
MIMQLGFMGLGTMGVPMATNLVRAGHRVRVWNRSPGPVETLVAAGAEGIGAPAEMGRVDVLFSILADDISTRAVVVDGGVLAGLAPGAIHVNMATVSVQLARDFTALHEQAGVGYVAAPVLGRADVAAAGKLNILAAGPDALIDRVQPLLDVLGQKTWRFGALPAQANAVKLAANFMIASAIETMGEAAALTQGHGVAGAAFLEMITSTIFAAPVYKGYGGMIAEQRFDPAGFKLVLGLKDIRLALEAGEGARVPLPIAGVIKDNYLDAIAHGDGERDWSALSRVAARRAAQKD